MHAFANVESSHRRPIHYWRLWLFDAVLVSAGVLFFLASQYGTSEFFGAALVMALLPFIPVMVLVGGAGSTIFALTKAFIAKRALRAPAALVLLVGPALVVTSLLVLLGAVQSPGHRLSYICLGNAPMSASHVRITGYSAFLRSEWLAASNVGQKDFQTMATKAELAPVDNLEFSRMLEHSSIKTGRLFQSLPPMTNAVCFKRVFSEKDEHERGSVYALYDPATSTAVVYREYND